MASGETELQFRVEVGGINQFGKLNSNIVMLNKNLIRVKQSNQNLSAAFKKQKGVAGSINKIFYGQAQTVKQLVRNQKVFRREITHITGKLKQARKETQLGGTAWRHYSKQIRSVRKDMRSLPLRKLGTDLRNLTQRMVKMGKNLQWVGRQMMVGITAPLGMLLRIGMRSFESFEKQVVRTQKILALTTAEMIPMRREIMGISTRMGVARAVVAGLTSDFAQMGRNLLGGTESLTETATKYAELTLQLELVGQVTANVGRDFIANLAGIIKGTGNMETRMEQVSGLLAKFNMLENTTALSLKDLAEAFPQVSPAAKAAGVNLMFLAGVIGNMKEVGLNATESAHALKFGLQRLINPTRKVRDMAASFAETIGPAFHEDLGFGNMLLFNLAENMQLIEEKSGSKAAISYLGELVGKRQASRLFAATMNMRGFAESVDQVHTALQRASQLDLTKIDGPKTGFTGGTGGPQMKPLIDDLLNVENIGEFQMAIQGIFKDDAHVEQFRKNVIATDMAIGTSIDTLKKHSEGLHENSSLSRVLSVAFGEMEPALKALVIDFMGASVAGKVFANEMSVVLEGPAATMGRLKNDMKNMLQEFAASFFTALKPIIESIRKFILKIRDMPPHMKQAIVVMLGMLAVIGPLAFAIAMMMVSFGVIGTVLVRILPKMKAFSESLLVSKHLAGEAADRLMPFGGGLAVVGKQAGNTMKNILGLTSAVHAQAAALQGDMTVAMSSFGAFTGLVTAEVAGATQAMLGTLGASYKGLTAFTTKAIIDMGMVGAAAQGVTLAAAATATAEAAVLMGGAEMALGTALSAQVTEFTAATSKLSGITAKTSRRAKQLILKDIQVIRLAMLDTMAALGSAGATTVATTAGVSHAATASVSAAQAKMFSTTRGIFAANNAMLKSFYAKSAARLLKMIQFQKISAALATRKAGKSPMPHMAAGRWQGGQFVQQAAATSRINAFTRKSWKATQTKISAGWKIVSKSRIATGLAAIKTVKAAEIKAHLTSQASWKAGAFRSARGFRRAFGLAFKMIRLNAAASATFMQFVFGKASKAIRMAMMGTGILMILVAVAGAIVFVVAHFDKFKKAAGGSLDAFKQAWVNLKGAFMEIGSAIFQVLGVLFGGEARAGADEMSQGFDGVQKAIQFVADALVFLSRVFLTYVRAIIIPIIEGLGAAFGWVVGQIGKAKTKISTHMVGIKEFIDTTVNFIISIFGIMVKNMAMQIRVLATVLKVLADAFFWLLEKAIAPVVSVIVTILNTLLDVVSKVVKEITRKFLQFLKLISPVLDGLVGALNWVTSKIDAITGSDIGTVEFEFDSNIQALEDSLDNGFAKFDNGRKDVLKFVEEAIPAIVGLAGDAVGGILSGIDAVATEVDHTIMGKVDQWGNAVTGALSGEEGSGILADNLEQGIEDFKRRPWVDPEDTGPMSVTDAIASAAYEGFQDAINQFVDKVKSALQGAISEEIKAGLDAFSAFSEIYLSAFETRIDAINDVRQAEKELTNTIKYETDRRNMINKMSLDKENFMRNRSLALYEGRVEDARSLSVQFRVNQEKSDDRLVELDDKRASKILDQQRTQAIAEIGQAKEDAKNNLDIIKTLLEAELNLLGANLPKNPTEWAEMLGGMNAAITTSMTKAFGAEGAAATSLAGFASIMDEKLGVQFGALFGGISVDTVGLTGVAVTLQTAVDEWAKIIEDKDLGTKLEGIFDEVNDKWIEELKWEQEAHASMAGYFDDTIATLIADIKYLKGELEGLTGDMEQDDPALKNERARRAAHTRAREGGFGSDAKMGWGGGFTQLGMGSGQFFQNLDVSGAPGEGRGLGKSLTLGRTPTAVDFSGEQHRITGREITEGIANAIMPISTLIEQAKTIGQTNINVVINGAPVGGAGLGPASTGGMHGSGASSSGWGGEWRDDDSFLEKGIVSSLNAAGSAWGWLKEAGPYGSGLIPDYHKGGLVKGMKGKVQTAKLLAGEYVMNTKAVENIGFGNLHAANSASSNSSGGFYGGASGAEGSPAARMGGDTTIVNIDTMVGSTDFAEQQAKLFRQHVQPKQDRAAGKETRSISSMSEL
jgi:TP901 family phage tail tape measure protein